MLSWVFAYIYVMTLGGPMNSTVVSEYYIYQQVFTSNVIGVGSAAGVVLLRHRLRPDRGRGSGSAGGWRPLAMSKPAARALAPVAPHPRRRRVSRHGLLLGFSAAGAAADLFHARERLQDPARNISGNRIAPPQHPVLSSLADAMAGGDLYPWLLNSFLVTAASVGSRRLWRRWPPIR